MSLKKEKKKQANLDEPLNHGLVYKTRFVINLISNDGI
jgi:hypothetical protein